MECDYCGHPEAEHDAVGCGFCADYNPCDWFVAPADPMDLAYQQDPQDSYYGQDV